jgi:hypothetical protein
MLGTLKKVSGRLKKLFLGRDKAARHEVDKPHVRHLLVVDDEESI